MSFLRVKLLSGNAKVPEKGSQHAAGYDLYSSGSVTIPAWGKGSVPTDIAIQLPDGTYGRIAPRSGLAAVYGLDVGAGVIDRDYRGPVIVLLFNHSDVPYQVRKHDRIAQLIVEVILSPEVAVVLELDDTSRGCGGFGSTGNT